MSTRKYNNVSDKPDNNDCKDDVKTNVIDEKTSKNTFDLFQTDWNKTWMYKYKWSDFKDTYPEGNISGSPQLWINCKNSISKDKMLFKVENIHYCIESTAINGFKNIIHKIIMQTSKEISVAFWPEGDQWCYMNRKIYEYAATVKPNKILLGKCDEKLIKKKWYNNKGIKMVNIHGLKRKKGHFDLGTIFERHSKQHQKPPQPLPIRKKVLNYQTLGFPVPYDVDELRSNKVTHNQIVKVFHNNNIDLPSKKRNKADMLELLKKKKEKYYHILNSKPKSQYTKAVSLFKKEIENPHRKIAVNLQTAITKLSDIIASIPKE